jgi:hypothetical protein
MKTRLFIRVGWFFVPSSMLGWLIGAMAAAFCATVLVAVDRHSHSASDTLYGVFPYLVCTFLMLDWIGRQSSETRPTQSKEPAAPVSPPAAERPARQP